MAELRPDPDALLTRVQADEAKKVKGRLKIFFGAAPGVGKTYTMLEAGREQARDGVDVLIGYIEPHVRPETQALVLGLDILARKEVAYRGTKLVEFDLEAALAVRPQLILVDELAHTNAPGMTHSKRWQDAQQLLDAGISVYTTLNVQHLESVKDVVAQITGVAVAESVPDAVFDNADEVELVDLPADDLIERLREGKIYLPDQAARAVHHFFNKGNLIALRELALRKAADRVGAQMEDYRKSQGIAGIWAVRERLLVCVGPSPFSARLVRSTRRMAASLKAPWVAVHVETPRDARMTEKDRDQLAQTLHLAEQLGAETATLSGHNLSDELVSYARTHNVTKIIVGKPSRPRWKEWLQGSLVYDLARKCGDIDVYLISGDQARSQTVISQQQTANDRFKGYLPALFVVAACTAVSTWLSYYLAPTNLIMIYMLGVLLVASRFGLGPSILTSVLSVAAFDFFLIPPYLTFAVHDTQYLFTFAVMLATAITISTLTNRVTFQAESARKREQRTAALYAISHELASARTLEQVAQAASCHMPGATTHQSAVMIEDGQGLRQLTADENAFTPGEHDDAVAKWVFDHGEIAGHGTSTLPGSAGLYLPLRAAHGTVGVLGVLPKVGWKSLDPDRMHLLEALAGLIALAVERIQLASEAATIRVQMETEQLRSSLLSAVSHDLRTPLSVITGATSALLDTQTELKPQVRRELLQSVFDEAERLNRLVANLLDMTRLEAGALELHKEWQSVEDVTGAALTRLAKPLESRELKVSIPPDLPLVPMDELLIEQVIINLVENAIKLSPADRPIELSAFLQAGSFVCEVADRGPGLGKADTAHLFEKFYRSPERAGTPGAGLGLAICRGIVELHGGTITAANRPGGGAVFRFTLRLGAEQPALTVPEVISNQ